MILVKILNYLLGWHFVAIESAYKTYVRRIKKTPCGTWYVDFKNQIYFYEDNFHFTNRFGETRLVTPLTFGTGKNADHKY